MKWIIEKFEEDLAVIECNNLYFNIPKSTLPTNVCEGDILEITINVAETKSQKENLNNRLKNLFGE